MIARRANNKTRLRAHTARHGRARPLRRRPQAVSGRLFFREAIRRIDRVKSRYNSGEMARHDFSTPPAGSAQAELEQLQLTIARDQLKRARAMTGQQRLAEAFDLTNEVFARMHAGAMAQLGINDPAAAWQEVRRRLGRLQRLRDAGRFTTKPRPHDQD